ncbi:MAG: glycosyltransferase N-terminal domain-containing protein, partial [Pseudomonadota bacterium]
MSLCYKAYYVLTYILHYCAPLLLYVRSLKNKEDKARKNEKLGLYHKTYLQQKTKTLHVHGASIGEVLSALPVIHNFLAENKNIRVIVTSGTVTSAQILEKKLPKEAAHLFFPLDTPQAVKRFLEHVKPDVSIMIDSEIWPNFLRIAQQSGIRIYALNMRLSTRTQARWRRAPLFFREILDNYTAFFVHDRSTSAFIKEFSTKPIQLIPNIKWTQTPEAVSEDELKIFKQNIGDRKVILLLSTHDGEEKGLIDAFEKHDLKDVFYIIVPRHPNRAPEIISDLKNYKIKQRSKRHYPDNANEVYLADTVGEVALWASLADICIMGKSFASHRGGHNPIEPALYGAV